MTIAEFLKKYGNYFLIFLWIFLIIMCSFGMVYFYNNIEAIKNTPFQYGMEKLDINSCVCYGNDNSIYNINFETGITRTKVPIKPLLPSE